MRPAVRRATQERAKHRTQGSSSSQPNEIDQAVDELARFYDGDETATDVALARFNEQEQRYIQTTALSRAQIKVDEALFEQALAATEPLVRIPKIGKDEDALALFRMLSQGEMLDFWNLWQLPRGERGPEAGIAVATKAMMLLATGIGIDPTVKQWYARLVDSRSLPAVFQWVEASAAAKHGRMPQNYELGEYQSTCRVIHKLAWDDFELDRLLMQTNIAMLQQLHALVPRPAKHLCGICEAAAVDGSLIPAWFPQVSVKDDEELKAQLRAQGVGPKAYTYFSGQKVDVPSGGTARPSSSTYVVGYNFVALVDIMSGLPIVWRLRNASWDEVQALSDLLRLLYELWPDCPLEIVIGDAAYDEAQNIELCELGYGLHPVMVRSRSHRQHYHELTESDSLVIAGYTGEGIPRCRRHDLPMTLRQWEAPKRDGLTPGDDSKAGEFRVRYQCTAGDGSCGTAGLQTQIDWDAFPYYPHHAYGGPSVERRHAERLALLGRRNAVESLFGALKARHKIGGKGANRTRFKRPETVSALFSLACTMRTALALSQVRIEQGLTPAQPPDDLRELIS